MGISPKTCHVCSMKFLGSIDEKGWFCGVRCKLAYKPTAAQLRKDSELEAQKSDKKTASKYSGYVQNQRTKEAQKAHRKGKRRRLAQQLDEAQATIRALKQGKYEPHPFYGSRAWQNLRFDALKRYGRCCVLCKATTGQMHVDHIVPRSKNPALELDINNLQIMCRDCNLGKGNRDSTDFRSAL